jgi:hypothetical protein
MDVEDEKTPAAAPSQSNVTLPSSADVSSSPAIKTEENPLPPKADPPKTNLERVYSPYLTSEDASLSDARARIRFALEQTRILREAFTDQVFDRYGVVLQPCPSAKQHEEQLDALISTPHESLKRLGDIEREKKKERDRVKFEEGENDPLSTFGGDGLHLVILPEEQPLTKSVAISAASAAAADGLLDRVRYIRGIAVPPRKKEYVPRVDRSLNSSPSLSIDSNLGGVAPLLPTVVPKQRKSGYSSMLTLTPEGETLHKNKRYNAAQMALLSKGVGVSEMKRDPRVVHSLAVHQRVVPKEFYETVLPPLLGARQVGKMEVRRVQARRAVRSVIREILDAEVEDEKVLRKSKEDDGDGKRKGSGDDKDRGGGGGSSELGLLQRLASLSDKQNKNKESSDQAQGPSKESGGDKSKGTSANLAVDPLLAYSVMSAVGLVGVQKDIDTEQPPGEEKSENPIAKALGLSKLMNLGPVSDFVKSFAPVGKGNKRKQVDDDEQTAKKAKIGTTVSEGNDEVMHIRGGGGGDEEEKEAKNKPASQAASGSNEPTASNITLTPSLQNQLFQQQSLYNVNSALGTLQAQLDPYQNAALAHQIGISIGGLSSYPLAAAQPTSDLSEYILRAQLDRLNYPLRDPQDAVTALLLREQAAVQYQQVQYQAALSSLASQNHRYAAHAGANQSADGTSKSPIDLDPVVKSPQRKRSKSLEENKTSNSPKRPKRGKGKGKQSSPLARPSSAPVQPAQILLPKAKSKDPPLLPNITETKEVNTELHFTPPEPPKGLSPEIAQLILDAKFHEAYAISQQTPNSSADLLIQFLLSLAAAIPIPKDSISGMLAKKLAKRDSLKEFVGESSFALTGREVCLNAKSFHSLFNVQLHSDLISSHHFASNQIIIAIITVCLWTKNEKYNKQSYSGIKGSQNPINSNAVISFAVEKGLHALSSAVQGSSIAEMQKGEIASIVNKSLMKKVVINKQMVRFT